MFKKALLSFSLAQQNIRSRLFHTFLSVLGIVIGVAALVAVLSLIDGMERYAQDQIADTTTLNAVVVSTNTHKQVDKVWIKKDSYAYLTYTDFEKLKASLTGVVKAQMMMRQQSREIGISGLNRKVAAAITASTIPDSADAVMLHGQAFTDADVTSRNAVAYVSNAFATQAVGKDSVKYMLGKTVTANGNNYTITGILQPEEAEDEATPHLVFPISFIPDEVLQENPPAARFFTDDVEKVAALQATIQTWLQQNVTDPEGDIKAVFDEGKIKQIEKAFMVFRLVMGIIVGISVLVGGIGIMNVLLISVNERTVEVGVRKAMGAKKRDIMLQFLAESITVSLFGSLLGLTIGILATMGIVPIIKAVAEIPFQAAYTWNTLFVIATVAIIVGIVFGTYPAMRAARLDPVDAIRREV